ncbi:MAG TPA: tetratricopeptide repeat protein, partial [Steroidobacteraceae bacterium]|nr:tetratricopeptide repeat protein [Steroidobacteraceae bacterium]
ADTSADVGDALLLLGKALLAQGKKAEAEPLLKRALQCLTNGYGADHPTTLETKKTLNAFNV